MTGPVHACKRCGIEREARLSTVLCESCRAVLTRAEQNLWRKP